MQDDSRQNHGDHNTQLVDGDHFRCLANLQSLIVAQPRGSCGNTGQDQEKPAPSADLPPCVFVRNTIPQDISKTTKVRMAVARVEFTPSIPIFARIEVSAANMDEPNANKNHIFFSP